MIKKGLDERQDKVVDRIGARSFNVMFYVTAAVIVAELIVMGTFEAVIGEMVILLAGGLTCVAGCVRNGIWAKGGGDMSVGHSLLLSVVCSGAFSIFYAIALERKTGGSADVAKAAVFFFLGISLVAFIVLLLLGRIAHKRREEQEKKYLD